MSVIRTDFDRIWQSRGRPGNRKGIIARERHSARGDPVLRCGKRRVDLGGTIAEAQRLAESGAKGMLAAQEACFAILKEHCRDGHMSVALKSALKTYRLMRHAQTPFRALCKAVFADAEAASCSEASITRHSRFLEACLFFDMSPSTCLASRGAHPVSGKISMRRVIMGWQEELRKQGRAIPALTASGKKRGRPAKVGGDAHGRGEEGKAGAPRDQRSPVDVRTQANAAHVQFEKCLSNSVEWEAFGDVLARLLHGPRLGDGILDRDEEGPMLALIEVDRDERFQVYRLASIHSPAAEALVREMVATD